MNDNAKCVAVAEKIVTLRRAQSFIYYYKVYQYLSVRGHSFLQCDRSLEQQKNYVPQKCNLMISCAKIKGLLVTTVTSEDILDLLDK